MCIYVEAQIPFGTTITLGTSSAGNVSATIGGSVTAGTVQSITVANPSLPSGTESVNYTVQSGDTTTTIATALTSAITSDAALKAVGVSAVSSTNVITFQTYPTYSTSLSGSATETLTSGPNMQGREFVTVGGMVTAGDVVHVIVHDSRLTGGTKDISYTVSSGDSLINIATHLAANVNADADLAAIGLTAVGGATASLPYSKEFDAMATLSPGQLADNVSVTDAQSTPATQTKTYQFATAYTGYSATASGTETISFGQNLNGKTSATISGTATAGDVLALTAYSASLPTSSKTVSYTAPGGDSATAMATALKDAINADISLRNAGITASSSAGVLTLDINGGVGTVLVYDANGNLINDGTNSYLWDWENRLIKITYPGTNNFTDFTQDGLGRQVRISETTNGSVTSTKQFIWCDNARCEQRNGSNILKKQFFVYGQRNDIDTTPTTHFYSRDHLGSVREMTNAAGALQADYNYDPFGVKTTLSETTQADFQYAGYYLHTRSGLDMTRTRAYSPAQGRFINRDPLEEFAGTNLYAYVNNQPINFSDPSGLCPLPPWICVALAAVLGLISLAGCGESGKSDGQGQGQGQGEGQGQGQGEGQGPPGEGWVPNADGSYTRWNPYMNGGRGGYQTATRGGTGSWIDAGSGQTLQRSAPNSQNPVPGNDAGDITNIQQDPNFPSNTRGK